MFALSYLFVLASVVLQGVLAAPVADAQVMPVEKRAPAAPHFVLYSDAWVNGESGPPAPATIKGFNVFVMSFLLVGGPADQALEWSEISAASRASYKSEYAAAGISLMVSAYGSSNTPTSSGYDPVQQANFMGNWVKQYTLDGLDVDYEDFAAIDSASGTGEAWLATFTQQIRTILPQGQFILTHAPVAPWFSVNSVWPAGGYLKVDQTVGSLIDWYNIQFYNQGASEYSTCTGLLTSSGGQAPGSSLFEISSHGITGGLSKLVIGKPATTSDETNGGYIDPSTLAGCLETAKQKGWNAGVMAWQFPDAAASWIQTVRSQAFPE